MFHLSRDPDVTFKYLWNTAILNNRPWCSGIRKSSVRLMLDLTTRQELHPVTN